MKKYKNCLIIGKFMPPHKGHEYMIRFAQEFAEQVHVVVDCVKGQPMEPVVRKQWLEDEICGIKAYALPNFMPQDPSETPDFWSIWKNALFGILNGVKPDLLVAAMDYGYELANVMNCEFIPSDIARESFPVSATMLRANIFDNWDFVLDSAKPYFIKKVCLLGPESTGKSTLGKELAKELKTTYVPEYAKAIIEKQNGEFNLDNVERFVEAQINTEKALAKFTNKVMICDSSAITTQIYAQLCFLADFSWIDEVIKNNKYDHYLLFKPDVPFVEEIHRKVLDDGADARELVFDMFEDKLKKLGLPYSIIEGNFENRKEKALDIINQLLI